MTIKSGIYEHYKGGRYRVIDIARHSETEEWMVLYQPLYGEQKLWVRPFDMFAETVNIDGNDVPRFRFIGSE
ncbi:DUF1653 domain-containing protein [Idiomarina loihiensis]|jgi:hypothetical protein|uniref:Uncharacterized conserved protein n=1 Tax=Idiomarina loihiensis (strain ATCC BAA-735 / DSM 15497 / L2-TR) TaxID=283942 RepID=Q5QUJ1_IDILO|nr:MULTISPECIES: DUF1653 domain-containing protein [Idiomarina]AAV82420.1 Uncharacterized conserved protein [Idiomarina loihiensis L2TR]AGM36456.1 hypothetical protein K734_07965 [Idiomarina loihiensis GSL 199]NWO03063.1 DUF1653 domain-containing protein [Idiomarinaceae bacterium]PHQ90859.1 MAG: DUF1653 domain-containing protein [Idiomarina sp.]